MENIENLTEEYEKSGYAAWSKRFRDYLSYHKVPNRKQFIDLLLAKFPKSSIEEVSLSANEVYRFGICTGKDKDTFTNWRKDMAEKGILRWSGEQNSVKYIRLSPDLFGYMCEAWDNDYSSNWNRKKNIHFEITKEQSNCIKGLNERVRSLEEDSADLSNKVDFLAKENDKLSEKVDGLTEENSALNQKVDHLIESNEKVSSDLDRLINAIMKKNPPDTIERREALLNGNLEFTL